MIINSKAVSSLTPTDGIAILLTGYVVLSLLRRVFSRRNALKTTDVNGPPRKNWFYGYAKEIASQLHPFGGPLRDWVLEYGLVHRIPWALGGDNLVVGDPKAVGYILGKDTWEYRREPIQTRIMNIVMGRGSILAAEAEHHRTIRRTLAPAFSNVALRNLTPVFVDAVEKVKGYWDQEISASSDGSGVIDVQSWMNRISFDSIGLAGFSHEFAALDGEVPPLLQFIRKMEEDQAPPGITEALISLLGSIPDFIFENTPFTKKLSGLNRGLEGIAAELLRNSENEKKAGITASDRSIIGILVSTNKMTSEEVLAQMNTLILAGFETTAITMTWALIELSRNPSIQTKLRAEIQTFASSGELSWDNLMSSTKLPYLDAFVQECLRMHPSVKELSRTATEDDIVPLSQPITTKSGTMVNELVIAKGQNIQFPIQIVNTLPLLWGEDAMTFKPERWIDESGTADGVRASELSAHRLLLTFADGPRTCLGKTFALAEIKSVLSILIKDYTFEFADGPDTQIVWKKGLTPRPATEGQTGPYVNLRIRRVD